MRGGAVQGSPEKVAVLGAPAKAFLIVGRGVAARARALATVLTPSSQSVTPHPRLQGSPRASRRLRKSMKTGSAMAPK